MTFVPSFAITLSEAPSWSLYRKAFNFVRELEEIGYWRSFVAMFSFWSDSEGCFSEWVTIHSRGFRLRPEMSATEREFLVRELDAPVKYAFS